MTEWATAAASRQEDWLGLLEAGMSVEQVIRSATVDGASICGVEPSRAEVGSVARFCLYDHDPRSDVSRLVEPVAVVSRQMFYQRDELNHLTQRGTQ